jgi:hypothetical protein
MSRNIFSFLAVSLMILGLLSITASGATEYEILINSGFEEGVDPWNAYVHATMDIEDENPVEGSQYVYISNKYNEVDGPRQYVTEPLRYYGMGKYRLSAWIRMKGDIAGDVNALIVVQTQSSDKTFGSAQHPGQMWFTTEEIAVNDQTWTKLEGEVELEWSQNLEMAEFYFLLRGDAALDTYYVDGCSMVKLEYTGDPYTDPNISQPAEESEIEQESSQAASMTMSTPESESKDPSEGDAPEINPVVLIAAGVGALLLIGLGAFLVFSPKKTDEKKKD